MVVTAKKGCRKLTEFGIWVKTRLMELNRQQDDLVSQLNKDGYKITKSQLSALLRGFYLNREDVKAHIREILK